MLHALPAVLWLASCLYASLTLSQALPPGLSDAAPVSIRNVAILSLCILVIYPIYRLGHIALLRAFPDAGPIKRLAALSVLAVFIGAAILTGTLLAIDPIALRQTDPRPYILNLLVGVLLMPAFFALIRGADTVREQITGARSGAAMLMRRLGPGAGQRLVRLQSADHYVEVHTETGAKLLLMRMGDAAEMLAGGRGGQVHRSHWVNFDEVNQVVKSNRKIWLRMSDGTDVPVSRSFRAPLRAAGVL
ncbi:MAG: LytTR family DNA-binding domain-containing protein [Pseudomonadota bacterium]